MALYRQTGVSVESWVDLAGDAEVTCEVESDGATLFFGGNDFVLHMDKTGLRRLAELTAEANAGPTS